MLSEGLWTIRIFGIKVVKGYLLTYCMTADRIALELRRDRRRSSDYSSRFEGHQSGPMPEFTCYSMPNED